MLEKSPLWSGEGVDIRNTEAHSHPEAKFLGLLHLQLPNREPRNDREHEISTRRPSCEGVAEKGLASGSVTSRQMKRVKERET